MKKHNKPLTTAQIEARVKAMGDEIYNRYQYHFNLLLKQMDNATEEGQEDLVAFLYASTALGNEIARRNKVN